MYELGFRRYNRAKMTPRRFLHVGSLFFVLGMTSGSAWAQVPAAWSRPEKEIEEAWRVRREVISVRPESLGGAELDRIHQIQLRYGLSSLPVPSVVLLREAEERLDTSPSAAQELIEYANLFSPDIPLLQYFHCSLRGSKGGAIESMKICLGALQRDWNTDDARLRILTNLYLGGFFGLLLFSLAFGLAILSRYASPVAHHWAHRFRRASPRGIQLLFLFLLILVWIGTGWLGAGLILAFFLWKYLPLGERITATLLLVVAAALPLGLRAPALYLHYRNDITPQLADPLEGRDLADRAKRLQAWSKDHPEDGLALFALAQIETRVGRVAEARELFERATRVSASWYKPYVNLAILSYSEKDVGAAISQLQRAISLAPQALLPHFNLGKILYQETRLEEGKAEMTKAKNADPSRFEILQRLTAAPKASSSVILTEEKIDESELRSRIWQVTPEIRAIERRFHSGLFPTFPLPLYWIVLGGVWLAAMLFSILKPASRLPRSCEKCGLPSCALCDSSVERESLCTQCYHIYVRLDSIDPVARQEKERRINRHRQWRTLRERWSTIALPGLHRLFRGDIGSAWLWLLPATVALTPVIFASYFLKTSSELAGLPMFPWTALCMTLFGMVFLGALFDAIRR